MRRTPAKAVVEAKEPERPAAMIAGPQVGDVVLVRLGGTDEHPVLRPAVVTNAFGDPVNLTVFLDAANDATRELPPNLRLILKGALAAGSSVHRGTAIGEWRARP